MKTTIKKENPVVSKKMTQLARLIFIELLLDINSLKERYYQCKKLINYSDPKHCFSQVPQLLFKDKNNTLKGNSFELRYIQRDDHKETKYHVKLTYKKSTLIPLSFDSGNLFTKEQLLKLYFVFIADISYTRHFLNKIELFINKEYASNNFFRSQISDLLLQNEIDFNDFEQLFQKIKKTFYFESTVKDVKQSLDITGKIINNDYTLIYSKLSSGNYEVSLTCKDHISIIANKKVSLIDLVAVYIFVTDLDSIEVTNLLKTLLSKSIKG